MPLKDGINTNAIVLIHDQALDHFEILALQERSQRWPSGGRSA